VPDPTFGDDTDPYAIKIPDKIDGEDMPVVEFGEDSLPDAARETTQTPFTPVDPPAARPVPGPTPTDADDGPQIVDIMNPVQFLGDGRPADTTNSMDEYYLPRRRRRRRRRWGVAAVGVGIAGVGVASWAYLAVGTSNTTSAAPPAAAGASTTAVVANAVAANNVTTTTAAPATTAAPSGPSATGAYSGAVVGQGIACTSDGSAKGALGVGSTTFDLMVNSGTVKLTLPSGVTYTGPVTVANRVIAFDHVTLAGSDGTTLTVDGEVKCAH
jgi:hypothetical protein